MKHQLLQGKLISKGTTYGNFTAKSAYAIAAESLYWQDIKRLLIILLIVYDVKRGEKRLRPYLRIESKERGNFFDKSESS